MYKILFAILLLSSALPSYAGKQKKLNSLDEAGVSFLYSILKPNDISFKKDLKRAIYTYEYHTDEVIKQGQCPLCSKKFTSNGKSHIGNARRHYKEICVKNTFSIDKIKRESSDELSEDSL